MDIQYQYEQKQREQRHARTRALCSQRVDECQHEIRTASPELRGVVIGRWTRFADELEKSSRSDVFSKVQKTDMLSTVENIRRLVN